MEQVKSSIWLDTKKVYEKDCLINMIISSRGVGKTYGFVRDAIYEYEATGATTVYLRRYKSELKKFVKLLEPLYRDGKITENRYKISQDKRTWIDVEKNKPVIEAIALSQGVTRKSEAFVNTNMIIFDEFILDKGSYKYIENEFETFHNVIETISRLREITENQVVKTYMLANSGNRNNPYFLGYNIPITDKEFYINDDLLLYQPALEEFRKVKEQTRWGRFIKKHTTMEEYMLGGKFRDNKNFIVNSLPKKTRYVAGMIYNDKKLGVFVDYVTGIMYITNKINEQQKVYALTKEDATPNSIIIKNTQLFKLIRRHWENGMIRFTDLKIKNIFIDILKIL